MKKNKTTKTSEKSKNIIDNKISKKAIVSLVIGIVTLIVLVIGATFSYYLVTGSNTTTTTAVRTTMEKSGTVTLTQGVSNIYLDVTAAQMAQANTGTDYYGMATETTAATTAQNHVLATIQATGGEDDTLYQCSLNYAFEATQIEGSSNDAFNALYRDLTLEVESVPAANTNNTGTLEIRGYYIHPQINGKQTIPSTLTTSGTSLITITGNTSLQIVADLILHNLNENQNNLAELGVNVSFQITSFSCNPLERLVSNGGELVATNNQSHMEIGNDVTGVSNSNVNNKIIIDDLTNKNDNNYKINNIGQPVEMLEGKNGYTYYATPEGRSEDSNPTILSYISNPTNNVMNCTAVYGIEITGNLLSTIQNVNANLNLTIGPGYEDFFIRESQTTYTKANMPMQVTKTIEVLPGESYYMLAELVLNSDENNLSSLYNTNLQIKYKVKSFNCVLETPTSQNNGIQLITKTDQIHMEINNPSGTANNLNDSYFDNNLVNNKNKYEVKPLAKANSSTVCCYPTNFHYYATPSGLSERDDLTTLAILSNSNDTNMQCSLTYGISVTGNMVSKVQELSEEPDNIKIHFNLGEEEYNHNNMPSQVTTDFLIRKNSGEKVYTSLVLYSDKSGMCFMDEPDESFCSPADSSLVNNTSIQVNYTFTSMSCSVYDGEIDDGKIEFGEFQKDTTLK